MSDYEINPGTSRLATRAANEPPPEIVRVEIETWSGDEPIAGSYSNLTDADRVLRDAADAHLDAVGDTSHVLVRVEWADGASHRTTVDITAEALRRDRGQGLIKTHLMQQARDFETEPDAIVRTWGDELRYRLSVDKGALKSMAEWHGWHASLAFIPSSGEPPPPIDTAIVAVCDHLEPPPAEVGAAWGTLAQADAAIARFVAARRAARRGGYVHVRVRWVDGMVFRCSSSVAQLAKRTRTIVERMDEHARYVASTAFAERNARTVPRRPLAPQRAWARELLRRVASERGARAGVR